MIIVKHCKERKPKPPVDQPLAFGRYFTDHMLVMEHTPEKGWGDPVIEPYRPLSLDPASLVFHYGQAIFEGMKAFHGVDGKIRLFRPECHVARLNRSARRICIPEVNEEVLLEGLCALVKVDADWIPPAEAGALYIRPFIIANDPLLGVHASKHYQLLVIASPVGSYFANGFKPVKIKACTEYARTCPGGVGEAKVAGNYAASLLAGEEAKKEGYEQVLWLDGVERKYVEEVGSMNIFFKIKDEVVTPELLGTILPGVTRRSSIELLKKWGVPVSERRISLQELAAASESGKLKEIFGTGTAAVISPVGEIAWGDRKITPESPEVGETTARLFQAITDIQYGKATDEMGWTKVL